MERGGEAVLVGDGEGRGKRDSDAGQGVVGQETSGELEGWETVRCGGTSDDE